MKFKIIREFVWTCILGFTVTSCFSMNARGPTSINEPVSLQDTLRDSFSKDGFERTQHREFSRKPVAETQFINELAGRAIWFKSAPNERHHTYVFPQKIGVAIDWSQAFLSEHHESRFQTWGLINDPDCCVPGVTCDQKNKTYNGQSVTLTDTFGWDYCAGDEELLNSIRENRAAGYRDPACDDPSVKLADKLSNQVKENRCELKFGTSAGTVGFRKFPNPRFNAKMWQKVGGYKTYSEKMIREGMNNAIETPFRVGLACASCHAGFDPLNSPKDVNNATWSNIKGEVGNQYIQISKLMASGMHSATLEAQLFTHTRPGTVDTSAVPHDFINNPGTMNSIVNLPRRPLFKDMVIRWNQVDSCDASDGKVCQKVTYLDELGRSAGSKFWKRQKSEMLVPHFLKGGEDSTGYDMSLQRVYLNNGLCSEECWQNNVMNLREFDFLNRGFGEAPFEVAQCRQQCSAFRANEDRTPEIIKYLSSTRPADFKEALQTLPAGQKADINQFLESKFGAGSIARGQKLFAKSCASCHSSQIGATTNNFLDTTELDTGETIRADWLGNDKPTAVADVGTYRCRALHTNHKQGRIWDQFSSETHKQLGTGFYRNISLINVWATAPFMHNNSIGPEVVKFDPSVTGRFTLFEKSMDELLTRPNAREPKVTRLDAPLKIPLGIKDFTITLPVGMPLNVIGNFDLKAFVYDFTAAFSLLEERGESGYRSYWEKKFAGSPQKAGEMADAVKGLITSFVNGNQLPSFMTISKHYRTCETKDDIENLGHDYGTGFTDADKKALKAFMATL